MEMARIFYGGNIITLNPDLPSAEALTVIDDRIAHVGSLDEARQLAGSGAELKNLEGSTLIPGFTDNHIHMAFTGFTRGQPELRNLDADKIITDLKKVNPNPGKKDVIFGAGWDYTGCPEPNKHILDEAFPNNRVFLLQHGGHGVWLNSVALRYYGITRNSKNPPGGEIVKDDSGEPTGVVREFSHWKYTIEWLFRTLNPKWAYENFAIALLLYRRAGITSVQDNTWIPTHIRSLRRLKNEGELSARFSCWHMGEVPLLAAWMSSRRFDPLYIKPGPYKYFIDGTFTTRTAWLSYEYADEPGNSGKGINEKKITGILMKLARKNRQGAFHAIGDKSISTFLDAMEKVYKRYPEARNLRFRLEHAQLIREEDISRLRDMKIMICAQPHAMSDPEKDVKLLGEERAREAYPYRKLLDAGINLSFGSDFPSETTFEPLIGIHLAVNRPREMAITPMEALNCYCKNAAFNEFAENEKGMLEAGYLADMAVLDKNPLTVAPDEIWNIVVKETILGGQTVYSRIDL